jgi:hypothetical protein
MIFERKVSAIRIIKVVTLFIWCLFSGTAAAEFETAPYDHVPWSFSTPNEVIAIGDVHGDLSSLVTILEDRKLIDADANWAGGGKHLVFMGDLLDRGAHSREVMEWIIQLEKQAEASGGRVHALLGNHEMMVLSGDVRYATKTDERSYAFLAGDPQNKKLAKKLGINASKSAIVSAMRHTAPYRDWMLNRNTIIKINQTIFVHAGVDVWASQSSFGAINASVREWIRFYQDRITKEPVNFRWAVDEAGPLWTRNLAETKVPNETIDRILKQQGATHIVIGHTTTSSGRVERLYSGKVIQVDTGLSRHYGGQLASLIIKPGMSPRAGHLARPPQKEHSLLKRIQSQIFAPCYELGLQASFN